MYSYIRSRGRFFASRKRITIITAATLVVMVVGALVFRHLTAPEGAKAEMERVRAAVAKLVILPEKEEPILATVKDKTQLTDTFLKANAENDDKILVYAQAKKVFIYRPSARRVAAIGPLLIEPSVAQVQGARILVRSGNGSTESSDKIRDAIMRNYPSAKIEPSDQSRRQDYPTTIVIDLTEDKKYDLVAHMAQTLGAQRGVLPANEPKPENVDVLIITGSDKR